MKDNLTAAVERLEAHVIAVGGMGMATQHTFDLADLLKERETILAELGRGASGEVAATIIHSPDELTRVNISMHGMGLGYGKHDLYTRPPVAGLAELTELVDKWRGISARENARSDSLIEPELMYARGVSDATELCAQDLEAAREFLGKV